MNKISEYVLISGLRSGDEVAYRALYDRHYVLLCRYANQWLGDPFWAETIVDEVISRIWEMGDGFDINVSLRSYLLRAVRNGCLNHLNRSRIKREFNYSQLNMEYEMDVRSALSCEESIHGRLLEMELEDIIISAVESLPEECRQVFRKSRYEHKKNEQIANELNISINTVKYHIKRALSLLHEHLDKYLTCFMIFFLN